MEANGDGAVSDLHLPPRQVEVCCLIASGASDKAVAGELGISEATVRFHLGLASDAIREAALAVGTTPREVVVAWYRECRRLAFARQEAA